MIVKKRWLRWVGGGPTVRVVAVSTLLLFGADAWGRQWNEPDDLRANLAAAVFAPAQTTITLQPVGNEPDGRLNGGSSIVGNEIFLQTGGQKVSLELRLGDWDAIDTFCTGGPNDGMPCDPSLPDNPQCPDELDAQGGVLSDGGCGVLLRAYQANLDSSGYTSGLQGTLTPHLEPCTIRSDCTAPLGGHCSITGEFCLIDATCPLAVDPFFEVCEAGSTCDFRVPGRAGTFCTPGFIDKDRKPPGDPNGFVFPDPLLAVDVTTPNYRYGAASAGDSVGDPEPFPAEGLYGGALSLDVSADALGTFTIDMFPVGIGGSGMLDQNNNEFPLLGLVPAKITVGNVAVGQCCLGIGGPGGCIDGVTAAECEGAAPGPTAFFLGQDCTTPCIECLTPADCADGDGDACTSNACVENLCVPVIVDPGSGNCCDPTTMTGSPADLNGGGAIASNVDGDPCTDDLCSLGGDRGVPENPPNFDPAVACCNPDDGTLCGLPPTAPGDINGDGTADLADFAFIQRCFEQSPLTGECADVDLTCDCAMTLFDVAAFVTAIDGGTLSAGNRSRPGSGKADHRRSRRHE